MPTLAWGGGCVCSADGVVCLDGRRRSASRGHGGQGEVNCDGLHTLTHTAVLCPGSGFTETESCGRRGALHRATTRDELVELRHTCYPSQQHTLMSAFTIQFP